MIIEEVPLPEYTPLSHSNKHLNAPSFNVEDFLLARSHTSLPELRTEFREYLADLKEELVKLINDDYEAFISLSTDLRNEGARLQRLRYPLESMKSEALDTKRDLGAIQNEIVNKLVMRTKLREEKTLLHLLLKISESITRLESLLLISPKEQSGADPDILNFILYRNSSDEGSEEKLRGNRAKHLVRVSSEFTQLVYHVRKAQIEKCEFVNKVQWRIDRVQSTLSTDLDQLFSQTIGLFIAVRGDSRGPEIEKNKLIADMTECLRTYDILGLWRDAEDVLRRELVRPFVKKIIHPAALTTPPSPIVPNTPFHFSGGGKGSFAEYSAHQIPYTPFTAFVPRPTLERFSGYSYDLPQLQLLEGDDDALVRLYNQILRFVERDLVRIMRIAETITSAGGSTKETPVCWSGPGNESREFRFMANVIWDEVSRSLMDEIGNVVFAAGQPSEFRKNYETTKRFIASLEYLAPSVRALEAMRHHPMYLTFEGRWQLSVYFQLRWKEIVGTLQGNFTSAYMEVSIPTKGSFATRQASSTWMAISACWSSEIFIPELSHRFWKLTLQILSRYKLWVYDNWLQPEIYPQDKPSSNLTRNSTPLPSSDILPTDNVAADDFYLLQYSTAIFDIQMLEKNLSILWSQVISVTMPTSNSSQDDVLIEAALKEALQNLTSLISFFSEKLLGILTKRCCDGLLPVRSIPSQFRAMSNKTNPTKPSYFISSILRPLKQFFAIGVEQGPGSLLKDSFLKIYATTVFNNVTVKYTSYLAAMKKTEEYLRRLKKGKKPGLSLFNSPEESNDEERIRSQMTLDVEAFGNEGKGLLVEVDTNQHFQELRDILHAPDIE